jgi:hypothetical protein
MESLKTNIGEIYFYIKNGVVFDVHSYNDGDECVRKGVSAVTSQDKEVLVPSFTVTEKISDGDEEEEEKTVTTTYFLQNFISDGDTYSNNKFAKDESVNPGGGEEINVYYKTLCEEQIKNAIKGKPAADFEFFNNHKELLGIPPFMLTNTDVYTVTGVDTITFDENYFNTTKESVVKSEAWKAGNSRANDFGYKLTTKAEDLSVSKLS